jgi:hypothetical protein
MAGLGDFRAFVQARVEALLSIQTVNGRLAAISPSERDIACCWSGESHERENVLEVDLVVGVRVFRAIRDASTDPYTPVPTDDLEDDLLTLQQGLDADQGAGGSVWLFRVTDAVIDPDVHMLDITVRSIDHNPFEVI